MADMTTIASAVSSLKAAGDIAKTLLELRDTAAFKEKAIELQAAILAAQTSALAAHSDQFGLLDRIRGLEKQVADFEGWAKEQQRYLLKDFGGETFAYVLREDQRGDEPMHRLCAACFTDGRKSILQFRFHNAMGQDVYNCPRCQKEIGLGYPREPAALGPIDDGDSWR
jgi:hypothetical protein